MITVRFLCELNKRLHISDDTIEVDSDGDMAFDRLFYKCGVVEISEWMTKKLYVSYNKSVYPLKNACGGLTIKDGSKVIIYFVMGGG